MALAKKKVKASQVKKNWYPILAPKLFNSQIVGEIPAFEAASTVGKLVPVNLMNLTGDMRKQNISMVLKINNVANGKLQTETIGYQVLTSSIKRLVKRGKNKVDYCFNAVTSDGNKVNIKIIIITRNLTNLSSLTALRHASKKAFKETVARMTFDNLISDVVAYKLQNAIKKILNKTYPIRVCEVRYLRKTGKGKVPVIPKTEAPKEEPKEVKEEPKPEVKEEPKKEVKEAKPKAEVKA